MLVFYTICVLSVPIISKVYCIVPPTLLLDFYMYSIQIWLGKVIAFYFLKPSGNKKKQKAMRLEDFCLLLLILVKVRWSLLKKSLLTL